VPAREVGGDFFNYFVLETGQIALLMGDVSGKGVGAALLKAITAAFRRLGVATVRTLIARDNQLVLSFFRSQGMMAAPVIPLEKDVG